MEPTKRLVKGGGNAGKWEVDYGVDASGKRRRPSFSMEAEADADIERWRGEQKKYGDFWANLLPLERQTVVVTYQAIRARGLTLTKVWEDYQELSKTAAKPTVSEKPYAEAVEFWKQRKLDAGSAQRYVDEAASLLHRFAEGRSRQAIHLFQPDELELWLAKQAREREWSLSSKKTNQSLFSSLWDVAVEKGWAGYNIVDRLEHIKRPGTEIRIYPNETVMNLMAGAMDNPLHQAVLAPLTLSLFGCMRPEEITSRRAKEHGLPSEVFFGWHDINLKHKTIEVRKEIAKRGDERTIRMHPTCYKWLKIAEKLKNPLPPVNERRLIDSICELIGLEDWIHDGLRHNCGTHLRVVYKNDHEVVADLGNSVRTLVKHYAAKRIPPAVSEAHWEIDPKTVEKYRKSKAWQKVLSSASEANRARLANETAKNGD